MVEFRTIRIENGLDDLITRSINEQYLPRGLKSLDIPIGTEMPRLDREDGRYPVIVLEHILDGAKRFISPSRSPNEDRQWVLYELIGKKY